MDDYIKRKDAIDAAAGWGDRGLPLAILEDIKTIPAADVAEVRHGEWMWDGGVDMHYYCSLCHHNAYGNTGEIIDGEYKYCPNCGAKMDGERKGGADGGISD